MDSDLDCKHVFLFSPQIVIRQKERRIRELERELNSERHLRSDLEDEVKMKEQQVQESGQWRPNCVLVTLTSNRHKALLGLHLY